MVERAEGLQDAMEDGETDWDAPGRLAGLSVASLWTTGPDTTADHAVKAVAMRRTPAGDWELFEEVCAPPAELHPTAEEALRPSIEALGLDLETWRSGVPGGEFAGKLVDFLGRGPVLVADGPAFEAWLEHLTGEAGVAPMHLDLEEMARLCAPGLQVSRGARTSSGIDAGGRTALARRLAGELQEGPTEDGTTAEVAAPLPPEVWLAFETLARRLRKLPRETAAVVAAGYGAAAKALAAHDPKAGERVALALALVRSPEEWAPDAGITPNPAFAPAETSDLDDPLDGQVPQWTRRAESWNAFPSLPPRLEDPAPFHAEDLVLLDEIFERVLPRLFASDSGTSAPPYRGGQHQAAREIARTLGSDDLLAVHAPTGTGKTLAYLVPALMWARRHGVRIGVATYTRSLQSQAMEHEVPRALRALAEVGLATGFRVSVLKGRTNYLCWRALCSWTPDSDDAGESWLAWTNLVVFAHSDPDGDLDRFPRRPPVRLSAPGAYAGLLDEALRRVFARSGCCTHRDDRATCGAEVARRMAERSHLVLTNHSFALARQQFFRHVVFDECEHLHEVAHNAWSHSLSLQTAREVLSRIDDTKVPSRSRRGRRRSRSRRPSGTLLARLAREATPGTPLGDAVEGARNELEGAARALVDLDDEVDELERWRADARRDRGEREEHMLLRDYMELPQAEPLIRVRADLGAALSSLDARLSEIAERLDAGALPRTRRVRRGVDVARSELIDLSNDLEAWLPLSQGRPAFRAETFYDVETDARGQRALVARVLLPAEYLGRNYYPALDSAVFLSATTWLQGSFDSALAYLGLDRAAEPDLDEEREPRTVRTFRAPEVFDYSRVQVLVPRDGPHVARDKHAFLTHVHHFVAWLGERTRGRMLVLFTNAQDARETGLALEGFFRPRRIPLYYQGMEGVEKEELAELFRARVDSILLGLDTFWYGADFPGETLEYLVLVRLPYGVPDRYHHAQCSVLGAAEQRRRIYQPRALAKFRQGFGRLLRTTADKGCVFVLDQRILDPRHRSFLRELPLSLPRPFADEREAAARLVRGDTDACARSAFEHMGLTESLETRGLATPFRESFAGASGGLGEPGALQPFRRDEPAGDTAGAAPPALPWPDAPPERIDIPQDELPF